MSLSRSASIFAGLVLLFQGLSAPLLRADNKAAYTALQFGKVDQAASLLHSALAENPADAEAHQLLCRAALAQNLADDAIQECRKAVQYAPSDSDDYMWLGRALGMKASHSNPIAAINIAKEVRAAFERAVECDGTNVYALSDLGEYYVAAPAFLGGSPDKARQLAATLQPRSPMRAHRILALLAQKENDLTTAETEFKLAISSDGSPEAYADLALFYQKNKIRDKVGPAVVAAMQADRAHGPVEVDAASILIAAKLSPDVAERALRNYLSSGQQSDSAPSFKAHLALGKLLAARGDKEGARQEYTAAAALAPSYVPAQKALRSL